MYDQIRLSKSHLSLNCLIFDAPQLCTHIMNASVAREANMPDVLGFQKRLPTSMKYKNPRRCRPRGALERRQPTQEIPRAIAS